MKIGDRVIVIAEGRSGAVQSMTDDGGITVSLRGVTVRTVAADGSVTVSVEGGGDAVFRAADLRPANEGETGGNDGQPR
jgi:hypothetical protein